MTNEPVVKKELAAIPKFRILEDGKYALPAGLNSTDYYKALKDLTGSSDVDACAYLINQLGSAINPCDDGQELVKSVNETLPILQAIAPRDELEGMLAIQMVGIHNMAMSMMRRAMLPDQTVEGVNYNVNRVTKLSRTFIAQMEALNKHRGKGKQKITVEHVTVNEGGQAIVGNVEHGGGGRDENKK